MIGVVATGGEGGYRLAMLERLGAEDARILALESGAVVGHTCKVVIADRAREDTVEALRRQVTERIRLAPRLRYRLAPTPLRLAAPAWVDDPAFDPAAHVVRVSTDGAVGPDRLRGIVADVMAERLDRTRPLWRIDVVEPLEDGRVAAIWRIHHALADGQASGALGAVLLWDETPDPTIPSANLSLAPETPPGPSALISAALAERGQQLGAAAARLAVAPFRRERWRAAAEELARAPATFRREFRRADVDSPLDTAIGRRRRVAFVAGSLDDLHGVARSAGATINDVVLALVAGGLRSWLRQRHGDEVPLRVQVPVSLHRPGQADANRDSFFNVDLPVDETDALERVRRISAQTRDRKAHHDAEELFALFTDLAHPSKSLYRFAHRHASDPRVFALAVSNVRGPDGPRFLAGGRIREFYPLAEIAPHHALRVSTWSFSGRMSFGLCADAEAVPDLEALADGVDAALDELLVRA
jgi:diacylglycerol O-acyltransferase